MAVTLGKDHYSLGQIKHTLGTAPESNHGVTYVPLAFAEQLLKVQVKVEPDGKIKIDDQKAALTKKGTITKITLDSANGQRKGSILVNGYANGMILYINDQTEIVNQDNKALSFNDLKLGASVEFVHDEIMTMSQPPMTGAKKIVVHETIKKIVYSK